MSYIIEIHELAHEEYIDAYGWYEDQKEGLGKAFMNAVELSLKKVSDNPAQYAKIKLNYRKAIVKGFPYVVIFELFSRSEKVHVASIRHMKQRPKGRYRKIRR